MLITIQITVLITVHISAQCYRFISLPYSYHIANRVCWEYIAAIGYLTAIGLLSRECGISLAWGYYYGNGVWCCHKVIITGRRCFVAHTVEACNVAGFAGRTWTHLTYGRIERHFSFADEYPIHRLARTTFCGLRHLIGAWALRIPIVAATVAVTG